MWRLSHWPCPYREESPAQRIVGATAAQNLFVSAVCTTQVYSHGENQWKLFAAPIFLSTGTFLSTRSTRLGELPPVSLLSWSRGDLVNARDMSANCMEHLFAKCSAQSKLRIVIHGLICTQLGFE